MQIIWQVVYVLLWAFWAMLWVRFVVDWVQVFARSWQPRGVLRVIPPLRLGGIAIDLGFLLVFLATYLLLRVVGSLAA